MNSRIAFLVRLVAVAFALAGGTGVAFGADAPKDFSITLTSAPRHVQNPLQVESITITADGTAILSARLEEGEALPAETVHLAPDEVEAVYNAIVNSNFFDLKPLYANPDILDGDFATIQVTANGTTHDVRTENIRVLDFILIAAAVNARVPPSRAIIFNALVDPDYPEIKR